METFTISFTISKSYHAFLSHILIFHIYEYEYIHGRVLSSCFGNFVTLQEGHVWIFNLHNNQSQKSHKLNTFHDQQYIQDFLFFWVDDHLTLMERMTMMMMMMSTMSMMMMMSVMMMMMKYFFRPVEPLWSRTSWLHWHQYGS